MNTKKLAGAGAATIGAATAVTALLLGSTVAAAQQARPDSAYALAAAGLLTIGPVSFVESLDGEQVETQLVGLGDVLGPEEDDIAVGLLTAEARRGAAETAVAELNVLDLLRADLVRTYCKDARGGLQIIRGRVLGQALPEDPVPSQEIDLSPLLKLTLNDQTLHPDGSLTVTGIELTVLPGSERDLDAPLTAEQREALPALGSMFDTDFASGTDTVREVLNGVSGTLGAELDPSRSLQTVTIGSATCSDGRDDTGDGDTGDGAGSDGGDGDGNDGDGGDEKGGPADPGAERAPAAPKPDIVETDLPVTG